VIREGHEIDEIAARRLQGAFDLPGFGDSGKPDLWPSGRWAGGNQVGDECGQAGEHL